MKKVVGYVLALAGLVVLAVGLGTIRIDVPYLDSTIVSIIGGGLIVVGIIFIRFFSEEGVKGSKTKQASEEVPIYEGEGKNRKIVGYRRD